MEENLDTMNLVDLRLTRPLPPASVDGSNARAGDNKGVRPPYPYPNTSTNAASSSSSSSLSPSTSPNTNMKIEQSEEIQLTPEQIRHKRADAGAEMFPLSPDNGNSLSPSRKKKLSQAELDAIEKTRHDKEQKRLRAMLSNFCKNGVPQGGFLRSINLEQFGIESGRVGHVI